MPLLFGCFLALALLPVPVADVRAASVPSTTSIREQLRLLFKTWDLNDDDYLDREELARAFRGPKAKPYEAPPSGKTEDNKGESKSQADKPTKADKPDKQDYAKYPDYVFLTEVDENGDGKVSRKEFETWAHAYATELHQQLQEEARLLKAGTGSQKTTAARAGAEVKKEQAEAKKVENQVKAYDKLLLEEIKRSQH
jgi:Ca2+-binding EF-hand superfamily protein